jgi:hypothetical protein
MIEIVGLSGTGQGYRMSGPGPYADGYCCEAMFVSNMKTVKEIKSFDTISTQPSHNGENDCLHTKYTGTVHIGQVQCNTSFPRVNILTGDHSPAFNWTGHRYFKPKELNPKYNFRTSFHVWHFIDEDVSYAGRLAYYTKVESYVYMTLFWNEDGSMYNNNTHMNCYQYWERYDGVTGVDSNYSSQRNYNFATEAEATEFARELSQHVPTRSVSGTKVEGKIVNMDACLHHLYHYLPRIPDPPLPTINEWRDLAAHCYEQAEFSDMNGIAYFRDIVQTHRTIKNIIDSVGAKSLKGLASAYLGIHFGIRLSMSDTKDMLEKLKELAEQVPSQVITASSSAPDIQYWYRCEYELWGQLTSNLSKLMDFLDLTPSANTVWDFVPFSFIVDWFLDIGDVLGAIDGYVSLLQKHDIIKCWKTCKTRTSGHIDLPLIKGDISKECYYRQHLYDIFGQPSPLCPTFTFSLDPALSVTNFIELGAIAVSRK